MGDNVLIKVNIHCPSKQYDGYFEVEESSTILAVMKAKDKLEEIELKLLNKMVV